MRDLQSLLPMIPVQRWQTLIENDITDDPANEIHTHGPFESAGYNKIVGLIFNAASATFRVEFSFDDTNWDWIEEVALNIAMPTISSVAGAYKYSFQVPGPRVRIVATNGPVIADFRYVAYAIPI